MSVALGRTDAGLGGSGRSPRGRCLEPRTRAEHVHGAGDEAARGRLRGGRKGQRSRSSPVRTGSATAPSASPLRALDIVSSKDLLDADRGWSGVTGFVSRPPGTPVRLLWAPEGVPQRHAFVSPPLRALPASPLLQRCRGTSAPGTPSEAGSGQARVQRLAEATRAPPLQPRAPPQDAAVPGDDTPIMAASAGESTPTRECLCPRTGDWLGGVRALRDSHVRLVLRQLRHVAKLNRALDRALLAQPH